MIRTFTLHDQGGRDSQQDDFGIARVGSQTLLVIADGMGGHAHGAEASRRVVDQYVHGFEGVERPDEPHGRRAWLRQMLMDQLVKSLHEIQEIPKDTVHARGHPPGTTATVLYLDEEGGPGSQGVVHAGDSGLWVRTPRAPAWWRVTPAHRWGRRYVSMAVGAGMGEEALRDGAFEEVDEFHPGEMYLLATDGLVPGNLPLVTPERGEPGDDYLARLLAAARNAGSRDNATGILAWAEGAP